MRARILILAIVLTTMLAAPTGAHAALIHAWPGESDVTDTVTLATGTHSGTFSDPGFLGSAFGYGGQASTSFGDVWNRGPGTSRSPSRYARRRPFPRRPCSASARSATPASRSGTSG